jgi:hypothetical protein
VTLTDGRLIELEDKALASRSSTVPEAWFNVSVHGGDLLALVQLAQQLDVLRAMPGFKAIATTLRSDYAEWLYNEQTGQEEHPGEAKDWREAYAVLLLLLQEAL